VDILEVFGFVLFCFVLCCFVVGERIGCCEGGFCFVLVEACEAKCLMRGKLRDR
jgi:hypothetical protein